MVDRKTSSDQGLNHCVPDRIRYLRHQRDGRSGARRPTKNNGQLLQKTLRVAQVRRISWVRRVGRSGRWEWPPQKTPLLTGHLLPGIDCVARIARARLRSRNPGTAVRPAAERRQIAASSKKWMGLFRITREGALHPGYG